jgi:hypothetical protein
MILQEKSSPVSIEKLDLGQELKGRHGGENNDDISSSILYVT